MGNTGLADFVLIVTQRICKNLIVIHKHGKICLWMERRQKAAYAKWVLYTYLIAFHYWADNGNLRRGMKGVQLFLLGYKCTAVMWLCLRCAETNSESHLMACRASRRILMRASFVTVRSDTWTERNAHLDTTHTHLNTEHWADEPPAELFVKESRLMAPGTERSVGWWRSLSRWPGSLAEVFSYSFSPQELYSTSQIWDESQHYNSWFKAKRSYKWVIY